MKKLKTFSLVLLLPIMLLCFSMMTACNDNDKKKTEMIVENPETNEIIENKARITMKYDGNPKIFTPSVKCDNIYLEHVKIYMYVNSYGVRGNDNYPVDIGEYKMQFEFNFAGFDIYLNEYEACEIEFWITIE